jgi:hypothetical protein
MMMMMTMHPRVKPRDFNAIVVVAQQSIDWSLGGQQ